MEKRDYSLSKAGTLVWTRVSGMWWPGEIATQFPPDLVAGDKKTRIAVVKFLKDDDFQVVYKQADLKLYENNEEKEDLIRRGLNRLKLKRPSELANFKLDVENAEKGVLATGNSNHINKFLNGDTTIIDKILSTPKRSVVAEIFKKPAPTISPAPKPKLINSTTPVHGQIKFNFKKTANSAKKAKLSVPARDIQDLSDKTYKCDLCNFATDRVNSISAHRKSHSGQSGRFNQGSPVVSAVSIPKTSPVKSLSPKLSAISPRSLTTPIKLPVVPAPITPPEVAVFSSRKGTPKKSPIKPKEMAKSPQKTLPPKKRKITREQAKKDILADWSDDEGNEQPKLENNTPVEKSDDEESGVELKIPRKTDKELADAFDALLNATKPPDIGLVIVTPLEGPVEQMVSILKAKDVATKPQPEPEASVTEPEQKPSTNASITKPSPAIPLLSSDHILQVAVTESTQKVASSSPQKSPTQKITTAPPGAPPQKSPTQILTTKPILASPQKSPTQKIVIESPVLLPLTSTTQTILTESTTPLRQTRAAKTILPEPTPVASSPQTPATHKILIEPILTLPQKSAVNKIIIEPKLAPTQKPVIQTITPESALATTFLQKSTIQTSIIEPTILISQKPPTQAVITQRTVVSPPKFYDSIMTEPATPLLQKPAIQKITTQPTVASPLPQKSATQTFTTTVPPSTVPLLQRSAIQVNTTQPTIQVLQKPTIQTIITQPSIQLQQKPTIPMPMLTSPQKTATQTILVRVPSTQMLTHSVTTTPALGSTSPRKGTPGQMATGPSGIHQQVILATKTKPEAIITQPQQKPSIQISITKPPPTIPLLQKPSTQILQTSITKPPPMIPLLHKPSMKTSLTQPMSTVGSPQQPPTQTILVRVPSTQNSTTTPTTPQKPSSPRKRAYTPKPKEPKSPKQRATPVKKQIITEVNAATNPAMIRQALEVTEGTLHASPQQQPPPMVISQSPAEEDVEQMYHMIPVDQPDGTTTYIFVSIQDNPGGSTDEPTVQLDQTVNGVSGRPASDNNEDNVTGIYVDHPTNLNDIIRSAQNISSMQTQAHGNTIDDVIRAGNNMNMIPMQTDETQILYQIIDDGTQQMGNSLDQIQNLVGDGSEQIYYLIDESNVTDPNAMNLLQHYQQQQEPSQ